MIAGYKANDSHASRLDGNGKVRERVAELQEQAARAAIQAIAYDAKSLFARLEGQIAKALEAGEHKVAMDGRQFMIRCFGYEDSPTLTHEHIANRTLPTTPSAQAAESGNNGVALVQGPRFASAILAFKRKLAERE